VDFSTNQDNGSHISETPEVPDRQVDEWSDSHHLRTGVLLALSEAGSDYSGSYDSQSGLPRREELR
jgi:hypothetical protein